MNRTRAAMFRAALPLPLRPYKSLKITQNESKCGTSVGWRGPEHRQVHRNALLRAAQRHRAAIYKS